MGDYATYADVEPRAGRNFSASSKPTSTAVTTWCTAAEKMLLGTLSAAGISHPAAGSDGGLILTHWIASYVEGLVRCAWDATTEDRDGADIQAKWESFLEKILGNPSTYDAMLNGSSGASSRRCLGYVLDNADDKSISNGDFDPEFTIDMEW